MTRKDEGQAELDQALDTLERETPDRVSRAIHWLRSPQSRKVRLPLGILLIIASFLWFLPVVGIELLPIGLLLVAQDVPFLKKPVGRATLWLEHKWIAWRRRRRARKISAAHARHALGEETRPPRLDGAR
jgi:hypothetical protein